MVESVETKEKAERPPLLYDLTTLQRDANRILGFTAQQTLDYTQGLYEKKLVTYPRTDSRYLTEDMQPVIPELVRTVAMHYGLTEDGLRTEPVRKGSVFDSSKVTDHYAIIPTKSVSGSDASPLSSGETAVLQLVSVRLLCTMQEDYRYAETSVKLSCRGEEFTQKGRTVLQPGWKAIWNSFYPEKKKDDESSGTVPVKGSAVKIDSADVKEGKTSPPKHFTEDTLLSAMESAGADETPEEAERKGLGTPATRAATIEKLVQRGFIERKGDKKTRHLIATDKGTALITVMPEQIQSPSMTAEWEQKLLGIEHGEYEAADFMDGISGMIAGLVATYEKAKGADALMSRNKVIGICPHCGAEVLEKQKGWFCSNSECRFILWKDNAYFTKRMVDRSSPWNLTNEKEAAAMAGKALDKTHPSQFDKVKEITDKLEAGIQALFESETFKNYLKTLSKFHDYSLNNTILIAIQKPDATLVAGYTAWQKNFGRQVQKGEQGIRILAPTPYKKQMEVDRVDPVTRQPILNPDGSTAKELKEVMIPAFKVVNVFDVSQTDGRPLPTIGVDELTGNVSNYEMFFEALKRACPVPIGFEDIPSGAKGYYHTVDQRIALQEGMSEVQTVKTLIHEMAHQKLHSINPKELPPEEPRLTRNAKEVEAESVAYTVAQHYGIETSDYSFAYIAGWSQGKDTPELKASLDRIRKAADEMITAIDDHIMYLQQEKAPVAVESPQKAENSPIETSKPGSRTSVLKELAEKKTEASDKRSHKKEEKVTYEKADKDSHKKSHKKEEETR